MMARPYDAWVSEPPHRHFGYHFGGYNHPSNNPAAVLLPSSSGIISAPSSDALRADDVRRRQSGVPAPSAPAYQSVYGPGRPPPPSVAPLPAPPPPINYCSPPTALNLPTQQQFTDPAAGSLTRPSYHEHQQALNHQDMRIPKPPPPPPPSLRSLIRGQRSPPITRRESVSVHVGGKQTAIPGPNTVQRHTEKPPQALPPPPSGTRRPGPISIPNLIGEDRAEALKDIQFRLKLRQQPKAARSCGFGERDRRVIDPPPIVELVIESSALSEEEVRTYRCYESYVMTCSILDESGKRDASYMPEEYRHQRRLMGSLVSTPFVGKDEHGKEGCFFTFSDLSCRTPGSFRLKFSVMMIDPLRAGAIRHFPTLTQVQSEVFTVYNAKDFPGMVASTQLAHSLKAQGCILQLKKGNDKSKNPKGVHDLSEDDMDDEDDLEMLGRRKRRSIR